ncbi:MAG TPA: triose-phosphate isomerase [Chloroflexota bacterium]|nr:triose-phosphate isomerase [Chloroflexota bacterium]
MPDRARRPIVAGNWKMNTSLAEARALAGALREPLGALEGVDTVLCPPAVWLPAIGELLRGGRVGLGAQNCHFEAKGAYTGEVAPSMLADLGCNHVIVGHSERRAYFAETDEAVARKLRAAQAHGLTPIVCIGENLAQREGGETDRIVGGQVRAALQGLDAAGAERLVIAYEPIWAIGTGRAATAGQANETIGAIRREMGAVLSDQIARSVRIQYGGSVTPTNAAELFSQPEIDGALVGGASLKAEDFLAICRAAAHL